MSFMDELDRYLEIKDELNGPDDILPIPTRIALREEMESLRKSLDDFEELVYDIYRKINQHDSQINDLVMYNVPL